MGNMVIREFFDYVYESLYEWVKKVGDPRTYLTWVIISYIPPALYGYFELIYQVDEPKNKLLLVFLAILSFIVWSIWVGLMLWCYHLVHE